MDNRNTNNYDRADTEFPAEFSNDFIVETSTPSVEELSVPAEEFAPVTLFEVGADNASESDMQNEQAASDDKYNNFDGAYHSKNDSEFAYDNDEDEDYYTLPCEGDDIGRDEQAATSDDVWNTEYKTDAQVRCELSDYEIMSDVLGNEKQIVQLYSTALCEAAEEPFRNVIKSNLDCAACDQYRAYEFMSKRGMYPTEQASEHDISSAKQQFSAIECGCGTNCGCGYGVNDGENSGCGYDGNSEFAYDNDCGCGVNCDCSYDSNCGCEIGNHSDGDCSDNNGNNAGNGNCR